MTEDEREKLYQKLGPTLVDHNPYVAQAFNAICDGQDQVEVLFTTVRVLAERLTEVEDMWMIERLKRPK